MFCFPCNLNHYTDAELVEKLSEIDYLNSKPYLHNDLKILKSNKELRLVTKILYKSSQSQLQSQNYCGLIVCTVRNIFRYADIVRDLKLPVSKKISEKRFELAKNNYIKLIKNFKMNKEMEIISSIIDTIHKEKFWQSKRICVLIIRNLFYYGYTGRLVFNEICNKIELNEYTKDIDVKFIAKVLCELLNSYVWPENQETVDFIKRFLNFFYKSLHKTFNNMENLYFFNLKSSLELCFRHIIQNISNHHLLIIIKHMSSWSIKKNVNDNFILNYSSTLEYAAYMYKEDFLASILTSEILSLLLKMITSTFKFVSLLGNRVLQHLIDRSKNSMLFNTPKIFFQDMEFKIKCNKYHQEDTKFLMENRRIIHDSLIKSFVNHRYTRLNLETTYCTTCLLAIEIPCGFTAASISCLMINLQEIVKTQPHAFGKKESYHMHAIIVSVLSLLCWIHSAKHFHTYINKIVMERALWAPHLNPPLQSHYNFAEHHVQWNKPELFVDEWEVRYGLWKKFRLNESQNPNEPVFFIDKKLIY